jgi:hypothetical protein
MIVVAWQLSFVFKPVLAQIRTYLFGNTFISVEEEVRTCSITYRTCLGTYMYLFIDISYMFGTRYVLVYNPYVLVVPVFNRNGGPKNGV